MNGVSFSVKSSRVSAAGMEDAVFVPEHEDVAWSLPSTDFEAITSFRLLDCV
jgi:hypothetical protein